jgi:hypothetical protein
MGLYHDYEYDAEREAALFSESLPLTALTSEADRQYAAGLGEDRPEQAWVLSDRDVWHRNPSYRAPEYVLREVHDGNSDVHWFTGWQVARIDQRSGLGLTHVEPASLVEHRSVLAAWRELRYLQELDAVMADMHPEEGMAVEMCYLQELAREQLRTAWAPKAPEPAPAARPTPAQCPDFDDDIPF